MRQQIIKTPAQELGSPSQEGFVWFAVGATKKIHPLLEVQHEAREKEGPPWHLVCFPCLHGPNQTIGEPEKCHLQGATSCSTELGRGGEGNLSKNQQANYQCNQEPIYMWNSSNILQNLSSNSTSGNSGLKLLFSKSLQVQILYINYYTLSMPQFFSTNFLFFVIWDRTIFSSQHLTYINFRHFQHNIVIQCMSYCLRMISFLRVRSVSESLLCIASSSQHLPQDLIRIKHQQV